MANSSVPGTKGFIPWGLRAAAPARTCGPLGWQDQGDPGIFTLPGDTAGALGLNDHATPEQSKSSVQADTPDVLLVAAISYGESSVADVFEEMAAIANVLVRQAAARKISLSALLGPNSTYAFAASDGNQRTKKFRDTKPTDREKNTGMRFALEAARNAITGIKTDYSNAAYFWDGADIKTNFANHPKVKQGIKFSDPKHNIYNIKETTVNKTTYWDPPTNQRKRGTYTYTWTSTAAFGGTIFWKLAEDFLKATGNKEFK